MKCECNEPCFFTEQTSKIIKDGDEYLQKCEVYKCNRLKGENIKKIPCNFNHSIIIKEILLESKINNDSDDSVKCKKKFVNDKTLIFNMLKYYNINCHNYFGKLNKYLSDIGYDIHEPEKESLTELKKRLLVIPEKKNIKIYIDNNSYFSQTIGEQDYDEENDKKYDNEIKKNINPLEWTNNEILQNIRERKMLNKKSKNKKSKNKKKTQKENVCISSIIKKLSIIDTDTSIPNSSDKKPIYSITNNDKNNKSDGDYDEDEDEDDDDDEINDEDGALDIEVYSEDDDNYDDNDMGEFSD